MYKIYINQTPLLLSEEPLYKSDERRLVARYTGSPKTLLHYIDMLEKGTGFELVNLYHPDIERLFREFSQLFRIVEAAGGIVYNTRNEVLLIHRLGFWDLPKGKIDAGESPEQAALREVREETGLQEVVSEGFSTTTYHCYRERDKRRVFKPSHWFWMRTTEENLHPQTEENIELAVWMSLNAFFEQGLEAYESIRDILEMEANRIIGKN
jgi:8-oxo-dGTP pyrophosphatase MutT (NUDIX family)